MCGHLVFFGTLTAHTVPHNDLGKCSYLVMNSYVGTRNVFFQGKFNIQRFTKSDHYNKFIQQKTLQFQSNQNFNSNN